MKQMAFKERGIWLLPTYDEGIKVKVVNHEVIVDSPWPETWMTPGHARSLAKQFRKAARQARRNDR